VRVRLASPCCVQPAVSGAPALSLHDALPILLLAEYGVGREGLPGQWARGYDDAEALYTPAWQETITGVPGQAAARIAREFAQNRSEEHTSELQSREKLVCRLLLEKKKKERRR